MLALFLATSFSAAFQARVPADAVALAGASASAPRTSPEADGGELAASSVSGLPPAVVPAAAAAPVPPAVVPPAVVPAGPPPVSRKLEAQINAVIAANSRYQVGVALIDVTDGVVHEYGVRAKFVAASTAKILAASAYYHLVESGRASLGARMGVSTAGAQIRQMLQQSNNESWALIMAAVGPRALTEYAASIGITYDRTLNTLTPAETARTLYLLYTGQLLDAANTAQLLSFLQHTNNESLIPAAIPAGISVFHKYGLLFGNLHDASILVRGERAYVFVVYTLGRDTPELAAQARVIRQLAKTIAARLF
ncbi:serine hydrolase [Arthrobacter sp. CG_A4]|uniref:serine hydrolase n=1 Tax=Arthrobacter sp. CG_A4 TaxID=3071706 RepID=UPI002E06BE39|nr:beta-lactamase class A [Arthrobacter sp. CG_A4]